jgi:hypothetical protein
VVLKISGQVCFYCLCVCDFAVQFSDFSPEGIEHVQLSFSFYVIIKPIQGTITLPTLHMLEIDSYEVISVKYSFIFAVLNKNTKKQLLCCQG